MDTDHCRSKCWLNNISIRPDTDHYADDRSSRPQRTSPPKEMKRLGDAFTAMNKELEADPEKYGFYGAHSYVGTNISVDTFMSVQYWRSQEHLNAYARDRMSKHFPEMKWSGDYMKASEDIGLWHESFTVHAGEHESVYLNCPRILLGKAGVWCLQLGGNERRVGGYELRTEMI